MIRIVKVDSVYKVQVKSFWGKWEPLFWSYLDCEIDFETLKDAEEAIKKHQGGSAIEVIKEYP